MKQFFIHNRIGLLLAFSIAMVVSGCKKADIAHFVPEAPELLVGGFQELQGSTVGPDKDLYVTAPLDGSIFRVNPKTGDYTVFTTGFTKRFPGLFFQGSGVVDVAFRGGTAYALLTGIGPDFGGKDIVGIYRVDGPNSHTVIADIGAWAIANPPTTDVFVPSGFQYSFEPFRDGFIVADGHHNRILYVTLKGEVSEVIQFENVVPTGLAIRGNAIYLTQAGPIPHLPENARLLSLSLKPPTATELATAAGLNVGLFIDVEFGLGNTLFVLAQGDWDGPFEGTPALPNTGELLILKPDHTFGVVAQGLNQPSSMEIIGNTAYVITLVGEIWMVGNAASPPYGR